MQTEIELEELFYLESNYIKDLEKSETLKMFPPNKSDYVRHVKRTVYLEEVNGFAQTLELIEQLDTDPNYTRLYFRDGDTGWFKVKYEDFKKLFNSYREYEKRQQFNNK